MNDNTTTADLTRGAAPVCGPDPGPEPEPPAAVWWDIYADRLARWAWDRLVNRTDVWGGYKAPTGRGPVTRHATDIIGCGERGPLALAHLRAHFAAPWLYDLFRPELFDYAPRAVVGLHAISPDNTSKWCSIDIDYHGEGSTAPIFNRRAAEGWYETAASWGFRPLLWSSNGRGGYKMQLLFARPVPAPVAYELARSLVSDYRAYGFPAAPETFPKQPLIGHGRCPYGNWDRVIGRHHTRDHLPEVYDGHRWLEGQEAIEHVLSLTGDGDDPALIPRHVIVAAERHTTPQQQAPRPEPMRRQAPRPEPMRLRPQGDDRPASSPVVEVHPDAVAEAVEDYMARQPNYGEGLGRHRVAFRCAAYLLLDMARPWGDTLARLEEWDAGNSPPLGRPELEKSARDAEHYGRNRRGCGLERLRSADAAPADLGPVAGWAAARLRMPLPPLKEWTAAASPHEMDAAGYLGRVYARELRALLLLTPEQRAEREGRGAAARNAAAVWTRLQQALGILWDAWRKQGKPRAPDCGLLRDHDYESLADPHDNFVGSPPCGCYDCDYCRLRLQGAWARRVMQAVLERTVPRPRGVSACVPAPSGGDLPPPDVPPPREHVGDGRTSPGALPERVWRIEPVCVWTGPTARFPAVKRAIQRAGDRIRRADPTRWYMYERVHLDDGRTLIVSDMPIAGGTWMPPHAAAELIAARALSAGVGRHGYAWQSEAARPLKQVRYRDNGRVGQEQCIRLEADAEARYQRHAEILEAAGAVVVGYRRGRWGRERRLAYRTPAPWGRDERDALLWHLRNDVVPTVPMPEWVRSAASHFFFQQRREQRKEKCDTGGQSSPSNQGAPGYGAGTDDGAEPFTVQLE